MKSAPAPASASAAAKPELIKAPETATGTAPANTVKSAPAVAKTASAAPVTGFDIQVGAFGKQATAAALRDSLVAEFPSVRIEETTVNSAPFYRVRIGGIATATEATRIEDRLRTLGHQPMRYGAAHPHG